jgi:hypothetical protein
MKILSERRDANFINAPKTTAKPPFAYNVGCKFLLKTAAT